MKLNFLFVVFILLAATFSVSLVSAVEPFGANVTYVNSSRAPADTAGSYDALAGNVTELTVFAYTVTQTWQGYFGNVSGVIQLADSADHVMYNWSLANPEGEVYATRNSSVTWTNVQCFNFTALGTYASDAAQRGATSLNGMNMSQLEDAYNITTNDVDGVNETFFPNYAHDLFYTNNLEFSAGECLSTRVYGDTGAGVNNEFEEVLLYSPESRAVIFASILDEESPAGFDNAAHDFEMLVLEDGHGTDVSPTTYWFYVELE